jgi:hypothetical protein
MDQNVKVNKKNKVSEFFGRMFDKVDKKMKEKAGSGKCCCCAPEKKEDKSCCK